MTIWYTETAPATRPPFQELAESATGHGDAVVCNTGDAGLLRSLDRLSAADASRSVNGGATVAAHVEHLRYGLSLMNRWAAEGGTRSRTRHGTRRGRCRRFDEAAWQEIRGGLRNVARAWLEALSAPRDVTDVELTGMAASVAHLAYHLGAIRQIDRQTRGPREGTL